jgi:hypothetical protein
MPRTGIYASLGLRNGDVERKGHRILLGFASWAIVAGYPHPKEDRDVAFMVLVTLTPALSLAVLFIGGRATAGRNP